MSPSRICQLVAVALAVAAGLLLLLLPVYGGTSTSMDGSGVTTTTTTHATLAEENGRGVYALLLVPVVLTALPLIAVGTTYRVVSWVAAALLAACCLLALLTIGVFYLPALAMLVTGAVLAASGAAPASDRRTRSGSPPR